MTDAVERRIEWVADPQSGEPAPGESSRDRVDLPPEQVSALVPTSVPPASETTRRGMRHRLARLGSARVSSEASVLDPLFRVIRSHHARADLNRVLAAYRTAETHHRGQTRKSGDPYITHPLAVATILAELGLNESTLCAALLHDTVEDTDYTLAQCRADFGAEVAELVDGVTKLDKVTYGETAKSETIRKMIVAMARDIRVLLIKLADRLHNMRTLHFLRPDKQRRIASETLEIYAPLAHRLGMNTIKWELEDLAFSVMHPKIYDEIVHLVAEHAPSREKLLREVIDQVTADLKQAKIKATVYGRPKHYWSIYQKMVVRGRDFADIHDLVAMRILVDTPRDCYAALGVMHVRWNPLPGRFKDYIAMPKFNMYQSLHTTVLGPRGKPVELQIRTHEMHRRAEFGVAAHWKYKAQGQHAGANVAELPWLKSLTEWQRETTDSTEFLDSLRYEINTTEVYVFTPKGDVVALPQGSTPVDFAYSVHTEVGDRCIGARVNGRLVPLDVELKNGDAVEVLTSRAEGAGPSRDWLNFVKSARARNKIRHWFTRERRDESIEQGKAALVAEIRSRKMSIPGLMTAERLTDVAGQFGIHDVSALYASVGEGNTSAHSVVARLAALVEPEPAPDELSPDDVVTRRRGSTGSPIAVDGDTDTWVKLAQCCTPVPGDDILGFVTRGAGVSVHRRDCTNAASLSRQPERLTEVTWAPSTREQSTFLVGVQVEGLDRHGLLSDVTRTVTEHHVSIVSATMTTTRDRVCKIKLTFETPEPAHLDALIRAIRQVAGIFDVYRVQN